MLSTITRYHDTIIQCMLILVYALCVQPLFHVLSLCRWQHQDPQVKIAFEIEEARRVRNQQEAEKQELEELILVQHMQKAKIEDTRLPPSLRRPVRCSCLSCVLLIFVDAVQFSRFGNRLFSFVEESVIEQGLVDGKGRSCK